jgi:hypothetical protein
MRTHDPRDDPPELIRKRCQEASIMTPEQKADFVKLFSGPHKLR